MNEAYQESNNGFSEEERRKKVEAICMCFAERLGRSADSWEKLSDMAKNTFAEAEKYIRKRQYKAFVMYLRTYSYLWLFARESLSPKEYGYFCAGQSAMLADGVT